MEDLLEAHGYDVVPAANGRQALDYLAADTFPDVILLDLALPVLSGWDVLRSVKGDADLSSIPVIVFTGEYQMRPWGADAFLAKPFAPDDLLTLVDAIGRRTFRFAEVATEP